MKRRSCRLPAGAPIKLISAFCLLFMAMTLSATPFYVPDKSYHCGSDQTATPTFTINYVEFRDRGAPWCAEQLEHALGQIKAAREANKQIVVLVYVHGWKNNSNKELSNDPKHFETEVSHLAHLLPAPAAGKPPAMVGIYLAWHGLSLTVEPFKTMSYWPRRKAARQVGLTGAYDAVQQITELVNESPADRARTTLIFVGHSFGARVLENAASAATQQKTGFMERHRQQIQDVQKVRMRLRSSMNLSEAPTDAPEPALPRPPADMIIYANAATASTITRQTVKKWKDVCAEAPEAVVCNARPFWLAFTSRADIPTGIIMPVANAVLPALTSDGLHLISAANSPWMHTHDVHEEECPAPVKATDFKCPPNSGAVACFNAVSNGKTYCEALVPRNRDEGATPFWIMNVSGNVVKDHGDIWNGRVVNMILSIMNQQYGTENPLPKAGPDKMHQPEGVDPH